jgi:hypothetical protein
VVGTGPGSDRTAGSVTAVSGPPVCTGGCLSVRDLYLSSLSIRLRLLRFEWFSARATSRDRDWSPNLPLFGSSG